MDESSVRALLKQHHVAGYGWALSCCSRDPGLAEDVLQTVYLKILQGKARYSGRASFRTWLFSVIRKTAAEERRRSFFRRLKLREYEQQSRQTNPHDSSRQRIDPSEELFMFQEALTDFLLEVPGDHLLRTAPQFDYLTLEMGRFPSEQNPRRSGSAL